MGNDLFGAGDLVDSIIAAFYQYIGQQGRDQFKGSVFFEENNSIHHLECGKYQRPCILVIHRAFLSFKPFHGGICIESNNKEVTLPGGL